ncbi:type II toxin-antitoxin system RelE/ParE family toxin [Pseudomonas sp. SWRI196]|uniref:Type II toxin-antitoxin system RelE/ParE family toxin n=1 Tax=Pseudomonas tehranensis TaxID=2745502 RepID=A0ABR6ULY0_9PSED|nr:type II toxin-antitoxin system RelE/ParE family toxin [Pseudomonas tehranensis]MBC3345542.1 type II toxin-antitoxin system RelE/ParE family toxin [Pseudomonas tehranensis]
MPQYRISNAARADIVDILRLSQTQFGDQARQRYQTLILCVLQAIADTPYRIGSHDREELAPGLLSYHLIYSRQQAKQTHGTVPHSVEPAIIKLSSSTAQN